MNKLSYILIAGISIFLVYSLFAKKKKTKEPLPEKPKIKVMKFTEEDFKNAIQEMKRTNMFPVEILRYAEKMYRLETNHFKSGLYVVSGSAGMEKFGDAPYYGWSILKETGIEPTGTIDFTEGSGLSNDGKKRKTFLVFANVFDALFVICSYIVKYNNPARWYSKDPARQEKYLATLSTIKNRFV